MRVRALTAVLLAGCGLGLAVTQVAAQDRFGYGSLDPAGYYRRFNRSYPWQDSRYGASNSKYGAGYNQFGQGPSRYGLQESPYGQQLSNYGHQFNQWGALMPSHWQPPSQQYGLIAPGGVQLPPRETLGPLAPASQPTSPTSRPAVVMPKPTGNLTSQPYDVPEPAYANPSEIK